MNICGIICEYNPFHNGHALHLRKTRELLGGDTAIMCVMSGNFVQRGDFSMLRKHARARCAVTGGADLVVELPLPYACAGAERFARGAVDILNGAGVVTHLSFGSECGDAGAIARTAEALDSRAFAQAFFDADDRGETFAVRRQRALGLVCPGSAALLSSPNNTLGIEYVRALHRTGADIIPVSVPRAGAAHDSTYAVGGIASASHIRALIKNGQAFDGYMPAQAVEALSQECAAGRAPVFAEEAERTVISRLRTLDAETLARLPDMSEGLHMRICNAIQEGVTLDGICGAAKVKRYTYARIRRALIHACLGVYEDGIPAAPPYIRVLAFNNRGRRLLNAINERSSLPVVTKPASVRRLGGQPLAVFEAEARATDLYVLAQSVVEPCGAEWRSTPIYVDVPPEL